MTQTGGGDTQHLMSKMWDARRRPFPAVRRMRRVALNVDLLTVRTLDAAIESEPNCRLSPLGLTHVHGSVLGLLDREGSDQTSQNTVEGARPVQADGHRHPAAPRPRRLPHRLDRRRPRPGGLHDRGDCNARGRLRHPRHRRAVDDDRLHPGGRHRPATLRPPGQVDPDTQTRGERDHPHRAHHPGRRHRHPPPDDLQHHSGGGSSGSWCPSCSRPSGPDPRWYGSASPTASSWWASP